MRAFELDALGLELGADEQIAVSTSSQLCHPLRDRLDECLAEVDGVLRFRFLQRIAKKLPGAVVEIELVFAPVDCLHRLVGLVELLLDGVATDLLQRAFRLLQLGLDPIALVGHLLDEFVPLRAVSMPLRQPDSAFTVATPRW